MCDYYFGNRSSLGRLDSVWKEQSVQPDLQADIYNGCIVSLLLCGEKTWVYLKVGQPEGISYDAS